MTSTARTIRIGLAQLRSEIGSEDRDPRPGNLERLAVACAAAGAQGVDLLVVGEMYVTGLRTDHALRRWSVRRDAPDPVLDRLVALCAEHGLHLAIGCGTVDGGGETRNSAFLIAPGGVIGRYDKSNLAQYKSELIEVDERQYYEPGTEISVFDTEFGRVGLQICFDIGFPEMSRTLALEGADIIVNCTASNVGYEELWDHFGFARSFENSIWFAAASVVGAQGPDSYFGGSRVMSPMGEVVAGPAGDAEGLTVADIDLRTTRTTQEAMGFLRKFAG